MTPRRIGRILLVCTIAGCGIALVLGLIGLPLWLVWPLGALFAWFGPEPLIGGANTDDRARWADASVLGAMVLGAQTVTDIRHTCGRNLFTVMFALHRLERDGFIVSLLDAGRDPTDDPGRLYFLTSRQASRERP